MLSVAVIGLALVVDLPEPGWPDQLLPGATALFQPRWLSTLPWAWIAILIATVWWTMGFNMIILLAALQDIPESLYEAAVH